MLSQLSLKEDVACGTLFSDESVKPEEVDYKLNRVTVGVYVIFKNHLLLPSGLVEDKGSCKDGSTCYNKDKTGD